MNNMSQASNRRNICLIGFCMFVYYESSEYNSGYLVLNRNQIEVSASSINVSSVE